MGHGHDASTAVIRDLQTILGWLGLVGVGATLTSAPRAYCCATLVLIRSFQLWWLSAHHTYCPPLLYVLRWT